MTVQVTTRGTLSHGDCGCIATAPLQTIPISLGSHPSCGTDFPEQYENRVCTGLNISTAGLIGANYVIAPFGSLSSVELLHLNSTGPIRIRYTLPDLSTTESADIRGLYLVQFDRNNAPTQIEFSGISNLSLFATGRL